MIYQHDEHEHVFISSLIFLIYFFYLLFITSRTYSSKPSFWHDPPMATQPSDDDPTTYLAQPPGPCCWRGTIHDGLPRGTIESILDIPTYIARPDPATNNGHVVLYFPDVWGLSPNAQLLLDGFADAGFLALGMDYFCGDPISKYRQAKTDPLPPGFDHAAWRAKHWAFATENVPKWTAAVKARFGSSTMTTRYACTGYCFGAPFVCDLLAQEDVVSAGAFAHPTALKEEHLANLKREVACSFTSLHFTHF